MIELRSRYVRVTLKASVWAELLGVCLLVLEDHFTDEEMDEFVLDTTFIARVLYDAALRGASGRMDAFITELGNMSRNCLDRAVERLGYDTVDEMLEAGCGPPFADDYSVRVTDGLEEEGAP